MADTRTVLVQPDRLHGWVERFAAGNGGYSSTSEASQLRIVGENGCTAVLSSPLTDALAAQRTLPAAPTTIDSLAAGAPHGAVIGIFLLRRGGYATGVSSAGTLIASKTGTGYVQSRTAAGGWSQQRFARRRANQASALAHSAAERAAAIFRAHPPQVLQCGGDQNLAAQALRERELAPYAGLAHLPFMTVADPRLRILQEAAATISAVRIVLTLPLPPAAD